MSFIRPGISTLTMILPKIPKCRDHSMTKEGKFMIFCAEQYKYAKKLTGRQLDEMFSKYRVWDYLYACYEALHTTSTNYIIHDIDLYIAMA